MKGKDLFEQLTEEFDSVFNESPDPVALLDIAIEGYSSIFDFKKFDISDNYSVEEPLKKYDITYSTMELFLIREFYIHFKVKKNDISDLEEHEKYEPDLWISNLKEWAPKEFSGSTDPKFYYELMDNLHKFLEWLRNHSKTKKKYPDKYYAWYHKILIALGKAAQFTPGARQEIINYGKNKYGTKGHGFYQAFLDFDLNDKPRFVNSLIPKDKGKWKKIIMEISHDDKDVINYLKKYPN